jgi:metacaspase-1
MKILAVHGLGGWEQDLSWQNAWKKAFDSALQWSGGPAPEVEFLDYDDIFAEAKLTVPQTFDALRKLLGSALGLGSQRGLVDQARTYWRWYAGMVVQWVDDEDLRAETRDRLADKIRDFKPDVIAAHSLGSLIGYDTATHPRTKQVFKSRTLVTLGSQVGNPFVVGQFLAGRIQPLDPSAFWFQLYNKEDDVFTASIQLPVPNFREIETPFDIPGWADHDAIAYIRHPNAVRYLWSSLARPQVERELRETLPAGRPVATERKPRRRALIVGIDEYPNPDHRLSGCVNDAFLMSSVLQEVEFDADDIRLLLNDRATTATLMERIAWLLEDVRDGDELYFHYSGHGTVLPSYDIDYNVARIHECLVPYDFDGSFSHAITDAQLCSLYSQLPYDAAFVMSLDCCHAGGMTRGSAMRIRGLDPPDDVRHRMLKWDPDEQLWVQRTRKNLGKELRAPTDRAPMFVGSDGSTMRLGAGMSLRTLESRPYDKIRKDRNHKGPYMPVIFQACAADELAQEYVHGSVSYGAFTYVTAKVYRETPKRVGRTFHSLIEEAKSQMELIGVNQTPAISGPERILNRQVPWRKV